MTRALKILFYINKFIFIGASLYYLLSGKFFAISIYIPDYFRAFSFINTSITFLENAGIMLITVPLAIVLLSLFLPEYVFLKVIAGFFALSGNLFSIGRLLSQNLLEEYFRVGFITIFNKVSLEDKQSVFKIAFHEHLQGYVSKVPDYNAFGAFVQRSVDKSWAIYTNNLKSMKVDSVSTYAHKTVDNLYGLYLEQMARINAPLTTAAKSGSSNLLLYVFGTLVISAVAYGLYKIYQNAILTRDLTKEGLENQERQTTLTKGIIDHDKFVIDQANHNKSLVDIAEKVEGRVGILEVDQKSLFTGVNENRKLLNEACKRLDSLKSSYSTLPTGPSTDSVKTANEIKDLQEAMDQLMVIGSNTSDQFKVINGKLGNVLERLSVLENDINTLNTSHVDHTTISTEKHSPNITTTNLEGYQAAVDRRMINAEEASRAAVNKAISVESSMNKFTKEQLSNTTELGDKVSSLETTTSLISTKISLLDKQHQAILLHQTKSTEAIDLLDKGSHQDVERIKGLTQELSVHKEHVTTGLADMKDKVTQLKQDHATFAEETRAQIIDLGKSIAELPEKLKNTLATISRNVPQPAIVSSAVNLIKGIHKDNASITSGTYTPSSSAISNNNNNNLANPTSYATTLLASINEPDKEKKAKEAKDRAIL